MSELTKKQVMRGADASIRLYQKGVPLDIIEAEDIEVHPIIRVIESEPLSRGRTQRDTHSDGIRIKFTGVRKGNDFLANILAQVANNVATGKAFDPYTALVKFTDRTTGQVQVVKVAEAALTELDSFNSGKNFDRQTEGAELIGKLMS